MLTVACVFAFLLTSSTGRRHKLPLRWHDSEAFHARHGLNKFSPQDRNSMNALMLALSPVGVGRGVRAPSTLKVATNYGADRSKALSMSMDLKRKGLTLLLAAQLGIAQLGLTSPALGMEPMETAQVGMCLIQKMPVQLARCVTDPECFANLACIQTCTGKPDEATCQVKCGDEFNSGVVAAFTKAAVSETKCVPQRPDDGAWPVPQSSALVQTFDTKAFEGPWYITAGLNPAFDTFDCQLHKFEIPAPGKLKGDLQWRIKDPIAGTNFYTSTTIQEFVQDESEPGILYNHDNEFLHYQDDWYILAHKPREYILVYYRGSNDAWDGYGGAVVYTTKPTLDKKYYGELDEALQKIGRRFSEFRLTDNTCKERESRLQELEADFVFVETRAANGLQMASKQIVDEVEKDAVAIERELEKDVSKIEKVVEEEAVAIEREIEKDVGNSFSKLFPTR